MELDANYIADLRRIRAAITNPPWDLCKFCESFRHAMEAETMVCQTVFAAVLNLDGEPKEPFSWVGGGAQNNTYGGPQNGTAFGQLEDRGYFKIESRNDKAVIFLTRKCLDELLQHLELSESAST